MSDEECRRLGRSDMYIQHTIALYMLLRHLRVQQMHRRLAILRVDRELSAHTAALPVLQAVDNPQVGERKALTRVREGSASQTRVSPREKSAKETSLCHRAQSVTNRGERIG